MKQEFDKKNVKLSKNYKKWAYAAAATGILITGAEAVHNTEAHTILAYAAKKSSVPQFSSPINIITIDDDDPSNTNTPTGRLINSGQAETNWNTFKSAVQSSLYQMKTDFNPDVSKIQGYDSSNNTITIHITETQAYKEKAAAEKSAADKAAAEKNTSSQGQTQNSGSNQQASDDSNENKQTSNGSNTNTNTNTQGSGDSKSESNSSAPQSDNKQVTLLVTNLADHGTATIPLSVKGRTSLNIYNDKDDAFGGLSFADYVHQNYGGKTLLNNQGAISKGEIDLSSAKTGDTINVYDLKYNDVTVNFTDGNGTVISNSKLSNVAANATPDLTDVFNTFTTAHPNMQLDSSNTNVQAKSFSMNENVTSVNIPVQYVANIAKVDENGNKTNDTVKVVSSTPTMSSDDFNKLIANQGYTNASDSNQEVDLSNPSNLNVTPSNKDDKIPSSLLVSYTDQHGNVFFSGKIDRQNQAPIDINSQFEKIKNIFGATTVPGNVYETTGIIPAAYAKATLVLPFHVPEHELVVNFVDNKRNPISGVDSVTRQGVTAFDVPSVSDQINELVSKGYTISRNDFSNGINLRSLIRTGELKAGDKDFVINIKFDKAQADSTTENFTGKGSLQTFKYTDPQTGEEKTAQVTINSTSKDGKMPAEEFVAAAAKAGYQVDASKLGDTVDLTKTNVIDAVPAPKAGTVYPVNVTVNGKNVTANVTADGSAGESNPASVSKASLISQLAKQGITVDPTTIPSDSTDLSKNPTFSGTNNVTAGTVMSYPQTFNTVDANGNVVTDPTTGKPKTATLAINSSTEKMPADQYIKAIQDAGYTLSEDQKKAIEDKGTIDLTNPNALPTVTANENAKTSYKQDVTVKNADGTTSTVTLPINSSSNTMSKADFVKALVDAGYTPTQDTVNSLPNTVDLNNQDNKTSVTPNVTNESTTSYSQPVNTTDDNGNPVQKTATINSDLPTISKAEYIKKMADQGFAIDPSTIKDDPVDLSKLANSPVNAGNNTSAAKENYVKTINLVDANGNPKKDANGNQETATVNIPSSSNQMNKIDLEKALAKAGYTLSDADKASLGDTVSLDDNKPLSASSNTTNPSNAYTQTVEVKDANGNVTSKSLPINSDQPTISKADYVAKLIDAGYTPEDVAKLPDSIDLTNDTVKPTVKDNANAATTYTQKVNVTTPDGTTKEVPVAISSTTNSMDKASFIKALADKGFTVSDPSSLSDQVALGTDKAVNATQNVAATTNYVQTINVKQADGTTKPVQVGINSANPTMSKNAYKKALSDLGYTADDSTLSDPMQLGTAITSVNVTANDNAETSHPQTLKVKQQDGTYKDVNVNINNHGDTMSKADYIKELLDLGYTSIDPSSLPDTVNLNDKNLPKVTENANVAPSYTQTIKVRKADGTTQDVTVNVNSANQKISKADYVEKLASVGYTVVDPANLPSGSDTTIDLGADNTHPVVLPNNQAHAVSLNVTNPDGSTKQVSVNVGNDGNKMSKSDLINAIAANGYKVTNPDALSDPSDLSSLPSLQAKSNASSYELDLTYTDKNANKEYKAVIKNVTPLITKQDLVKQLKDQGYTISDTSRLKDIINLDNPEDTKDLASLLAPYAPYQVNIDVAGTNDTVTIPSRTQTISKQQVIDRLKAEGYTLTNPEVLKDTLDMTNPEDFKGMIVTKGVASDDITSNNTTNSITTTDNGNNNANIDNNNHAKDSDKKTKKHSKKHSVIDNHKNNSGKSTTNGANKNGSLPQTGDATDQSRTAGFGLIAAIMGSILAFFGLKKRKNDDD